MPAATGNVRLPWSRCLSHLFVAEHLGADYVLDVKRQRLIAAKDLADCQTVKFEFTREGISRDGFLARYQGKLVAYENVCRHLPLSLDYGDNRFFAKDGRHFVCQNHGAIFQPLTGLCVRGPCQGASLKPLAIEVVSGEVWLNEA